MFVGIADLYDMCKMAEDKRQTKNILLKILDSNGKIKEVPMGYGHYVVDSIWFAEIGGDNATNTNRFIYELEEECEKYPQSWGNIYVAPMEQVKDCELRFVDNILDAEETTEQYEIVNIKEEDSIIICLRQINEKVKKYLSYDEIKKELEELNKKQNGKEYWRMLVLGALENLMEVGKEYKVTEEDLDRIVEDLMSNQSIWNTIDGEIGCYLFIFCDK